MRRILSTGRLLLALTGAAWWIPGCAGDDEGSPVDGAVVLDAAHTTIPDAQIQPDTSQPIDADFPDGGQDGGN